MAYAEIELDRGPGPYFSGETLSGKVLISRRGILTKSIYVRCVGKARTYFGVIFVSRHSSRPREIKDEEEFINQEICIFNIPGSSPRGRSPRGSTTPTVQFGPEHFYQFSFFLPLTLPSSFAETEGYITYKISAQLLLSGTEDNFDLNPEPVEIPFRVKRNLDLNVHPLAGLSGELRDYKYVGCFTSCTVTRGTVSLFFKINQRGYTPGETIPFTTEVNNNTNGNVSSRVFVMQDLVFYVGIERRRMTLNLCSKVGPDIPSGGSVQWMDSLILPSNPSFVRTCSINCGIIQIHHQIHIQLVGLRWITKTEEIILEGCIPLILGDIPLRPSPLPDTEDLLFSPGIANYYSRSPSPCPPMTATTTVQNSSTSSSSYPLPNFSDFASSPQRSDPPEYFELEESAFALNASSKEVEEYSPPTYSEATTKLDLSNS